jgi:hypothetical protein
MTTRATRRVRASSGGAGLGAVAVVALGAISCGPWSAPRNLNVNRVTWPQDVGIVRVHDRRGYLVQTDESYLRDHVEEPPASATGEAVAPATAYIYNVGCEVRVGRAGDATREGAPLPAALAAILQGACWVDGVFIPWEHEVCRLGGSITVDGHPLAVDGGFCYDPATARWRVVMLDSVPPALSGSSAVHATCSVVRLDGERAVQCWVRTGGGHGSPGGGLVEHIPERTSFETFVLDGLR